MTIDDFDDVLYRASIGRHIMRVKLVLRSRLLTKTFGELAAIFDDALVSILDTIFAEVEDAPSVIAYRFGVDYDRSIV